MDASFQVAFVWTEADGIIDLNTVIAPELGWRLGAAYAINSHGQIAGKGYDGAKTSAFRLDPIAPEPSIKISGTNAVVSWSPPWPGVILESSAKIVAPTWQVVPNATTNHVSVPLTATTRFFRLNLDALRGVCCAP